MLSVFKLNVVMLSVTVPFWHDTILAKLFRDMYNPRWYQVSDYTVLACFIIFKLSVTIAKFFLVKRVPCQGPEQRESGNTVLYLLIVIIILISILLYIIIKLEIKMRTIPAKTGNRTLNNVYIKSSI
jgi:hypothetical protein